MCRVGLCTYRIQDCLGFHNASHIPCAMIFTTDTQMHDAAYNHLYSDSDTILIPYSPFPQFPRSQTPHCTFIASGSFTYGNPQIIDGS